MTSSEPRAFLLHLFGNLLSHKISEDLHFEVSGVAPTALQNRLRSYAAKQVTDTNELPGTGYGNSRCSHDLELRVQERRECDVLSIEHKGAG